MALDSGRQGVLEGGQLACERGDMRLDRPLDAWRGRAEAVALGRQHRAHLPAPQDQRPHLARVDHDDREASSGQRGPHAALRFAYSSLSQKIRVDIVNHRQRTLKLECRGKAGRVGELLCAVLPARSVVPGMISIHRRDGEFLVTATAVVVLKFGAKLHC